jgi:hypothetical protein
LFSHYACAETHLGPVGQACAAAGLSLDVMGAASGRLCARPEAVLGDYDLVFAKARCALEAMASGCAVVLCDAEGAGPMVRARDWHRLRAWNFGRRVCAGPLTAQALLEQIRHYDPADAAEACRLTRAEAGVPAAVDALVGLYREVIEDYRPTGADASEEAWAVAEYLHRQLPYPLLSRVAERDHEGERLRHAADVARAGLHSAQQEAEAMRQVAEQVHEGWKRALREAEASRQEAESTRQEAEGTRRMAEEVHAGWKNAHDAAGRLGADVERLGAAAEQARAECERSRQEVESLRALLDRTLSRRVRRGGERCLSWLRRRLRRAG